MKINKMTNENLLKFFLSLQFLVMQMYGRVVTLNAVYDRMQEIKEHQHGRYIASVCMILERYLRYSSYLGDEIGIK